MKFLQFGYEARSTCRLGFEQWTSKDCATPNHPLQCFNKSIHPIGRRDDLEGLISGVDIEDEISEPWLPTAGCSKKLILDIYQA